jgi:hypothetical protein
MVHCTFNVRCICIHIRPGTHRCHREERSLRRSHLNRRGLGCTIAIGQSAACDLRLLQSLRSFAMTRGRGARTGTHRCHREERSLRRSDLNWRGPGCTIVIGQSAACGLGLLQSLRSFAMTRGRGARTGTHRCHCDERSLRRSDLNWRGPGCTIGIGQSAA